MKVSFPDRTSALNDDTREDIRRRMHFALSRFGTHIEQVTVRIVDTAEDRDGSQVLCRLSVRMKRLGSFSIESVKDKVAVAVSWAADRAAQRVQRILDRQRNETSLNESK